MNYEGPFALATQPKGPKTPRRVRESPAPEPAPVGHGHKTWRCGDCPLRGSVDRRDGLGQLGWGVAVLYVGDLWKVN